MSWRWLEGDALKAAFQGFETDEALEDEMERREPLVKHLAALLVQQRRDRENEGFEREARREDGADFGEDDDEDDDTARELRRIVRCQREAVKVAEVTVLEEELAKLGARLARVYEHWNEDEAYMAYRERA